MTKDLKCDNCGKHFSILYDFGNAKLCHDCLNYFAKLEQSEDDNEEGYNEEPMLKPAVNYKVVDDAIEIYMANDSWDDFVKELTDIHDVTDEQAMILWQAFDVAEETWMIIED